MSSRYRATTVKPKVTSPVVPKDAFSLESAQNSLFHAFLIWSAFALAWIFIAAPYLLTPGQLRILEYFSPRRWFEAAFNALQKSDVEVVEKTPGATDPATARQNVLNKALANLGLVSGLNDLSPVAEESLLDLSSIDKKNESVDESSSRYLWFLMERPDIHDATENPFRQLTPSAIMDDPSKKQLESILQTPPPSPVLRLRKNEIKTYEQNTDNQRSPTGAGSLSPDPPRTLDAARVADPQYFSAGVEKLIREMLQDVMVQNTPEASAQNRLNQQQIEEMANLGDLMDPNNLNDFLRDPNNLNNLLSGPHGALDDSIVQSTIAQISSIMEKVVNMENPDEVWEQQPRLHGGPIITEIKPDSAVNQEKPLETEVQPNPNTAGGRIYKCDIDTSKNFRLPKWIPCEISINHKHLLLKYNDKVIEFTVVHEHLGRQLWEGRK